MFGQIDFEDALLGGVFTLASLSSTGLYVGGNFTPLDVSLGDSVWSAGATTITIAFVLSLIAIGGAYATNRVSGGGSRRNVSVNTDLGDILSGKANYETYIAGGTLIIVVLNGLNIAGVSGFITGNVWAGLSVFGLQLGGYYVFSWMG